MRHASPDLKLNAHCTSIALHALPRIVTEPLILEQFAPVFTQIAQLPQFLADRLLRAGFHPGKRRCMIEAAEDGIATRGADMKFPTRVSVTLVLIATTSLFIPEQSWGDVALHGQSADATTLARSESEPSARAVVAPAKCKKLRQALKRTKKSSVAKRRVLRKRIKVACRKISPVVTTPTPTPEPDTEQARAMCTIDDPRIRELSGLASSALHPTVLWTHNDSGDQARVFAVDITTCGVVAEVDLTGVVARDFEAIGRGVDTGGNSVIWVADIGDNAGNRGNVTLYRFPEPASLTDQQVVPDPFTVTYDGGARNAEGILVGQERGGPVWIVSKEANGGIYELTAGFQQVGSAVATRIADVPSFLTDAAAKADLSTVLLRSGDFGQVRRGLVTNEPTENFTFPHQQQGEAMTFSADERYVYIASEGVTELIRIPADQLP